MRGRYLIECRFLKVMLIDSDNDKKYMGPHANIPCVHNFVFKAEEICFISGHMKNFHNLFSHRSRQLLVTTEEHICPLTMQNWQQMTLKPSK